MPSQINAMSWASVLHHPGLLVPLPWFNKNPEVLSLKPDYSQASIKVYNNSLSIRGVLPCVSIWPKTLSQPWQWWCNYYFSELLIRRKIFYLCKEFINQSVYLFKDRCGQQAAAIMFVTIILINMFAEVSVWTDMVVCK